MPNRLYNILVPVDFTGKNKWAIAKAIEIANSFGCNIHLIHVVNKNLVPLLPIHFAGLSYYESHTARVNAYERLKEMAGHYSNQLCGKGTIEISVIEGHPSKRIAAYIREFEMDMAIIGLSKFNLVQRIISSISVSQLARNTNIPVLAVGSGGLICHFKKIILPLHDGVSISRVRMATTLARSFRSTIYMVTLRNGNNIPKKIINEALQMAQSISTIPVQGIILEGKNLAKATLQFARKINADLIMINPLKEFYLPGWWNKLTKKLLSHASTIPVMTISKQ